MHDKEYKINIFKSKLETAFVENYNEINNAKDLINLKLKESNINYEYTYNTFCVDLLNEGLSLVSKIDEIENIILINFLFILLNNMIINKVEEKKILK
jgi:hypothetical protein